MKKLIALNIALICLVGILVSYIFIQRNLFEYKPQLISLGSLFERKVRYGENLRVYGYLVKGDKFSYLYPNMQISEMNGMHAKWLEAVVWSDPEVLDPDCFNSTVVISGKSVPYMGFALGFDEISDFMNMETGTSCLPEGVPKMVNYFKTIMGNEK